MKAEAHLPAPPVARIRLLVRGNVQGVGFRPFVYRCARELGLGGWVRNSTAGVEVEVEGPGTSLDSFIYALSHNTPANAVVETLDSQSMRPVGEPAFVIRDSEPAGERGARVQPDLATCAHCLEEILDPGNRRYLYPFTTCTQCGPRYSIVEALPWDRARTSMKAFRMCPRCREEYRDPADRRFHSETNACPDCGPRLTLLNPDQDEPAHGNEALLEAAAALRRGAVVALKGLGGFQLLVDARNHDAVARLRECKQRPDKPFAVMFPTMAGAAAQCRISKDEAVLLRGPQAPIVLLRRHETVARVDSVAGIVAPGIPCLGAMLPYTPLHHLLMRELGFPVVATSGNRSGEPIAIDNREALDRLKTIADLFLVHDRPIARPVDDSVLRPAADGPLFLRRARGYAPAPVAPCKGSDGVLALGGHLKSTITLGTQGQFVPSQHIGDLDTQEARDIHAAMVADLNRLTGVSARIAACDQHPDYHSTRFADTLECPVVQVQHHFAHVLSCMAEHELSPPVLGVAFDGAGYGSDGTVWGGEFLRVTEDGFQRAGHLRTFRLPGGEAAMREPRRAAAGLLFELLGDGFLDIADVASLSAFEPHERRVLGRMLARGLNSPITSSAGRLFDAVASLCGLRQQSTYEGQAGCELEWCAGAQAGDADCRFDIRKSNDGEGLVLDWGPVIACLLEELGTGIPVSRCAATFHDALVDGTVRMAGRMGISTIVLGGGCFQNVRLLDATMRALHRNGFTPFRPKRLPPNDGGLSLGQAAWAAGMRARGLR